MRQALLDEEIMPHLRVVLVVSSLTIGATGLCHCSRNIRASHLQNLDPQHIVKDIWRVPEGLQRDWILLSASVAPLPRFDELIRNAVGNNWGQLCERLQIVKAAIASLIDDKPAFDESHLKAIMYPERTMYDDKAMHAIMGFVYSNSFLSIGNRNWEPDFEPEGSLAFLSARMNLGPDSQAEPIP